MLKTLTHSKKLPILIILAMIFSFLPVAPTPVRAAFNLSGGSVTEEFNSGQGFFDNAEQMDFTSGVAQVEDYDPRNYGMDHYEVLGDDGDPSQILDSNGSYEKGDFDSVMGDDEFYFVYYHYQDGKVYVRQWDKQNSIIGVDWVDQGALGSEVHSGDARNLDITLDSSGTPYVAFVNASDQIEVKKWNSGTSSWDSLGTRGTDADMPELAVSSGGTVYLAYGSGATTTSYNLDIDSYNGSWSSFQADIINATCDGAYGGALTCALFSDEKISMKLSGANPVLGFTKYVYMDGMGAMFSVNVQKWNGSSWDYYYGDGLSDVGIAQASNQIDITLTDNDKLGMVYVDHSGDPAIHLLEGTFSTMSGFSDLTTGSAWEGNQPQVTYLSSGDYAGYYVSANSDSGSPDGHVLLWYDSANGNFEYVDGSGYSNDALNTKPHINLNANDSTPYHFFVNNDEDEINHNLCPALYYNYTEGSLATSINTGSATDTLYLDFDMVPQDGSVFVSLKRSTEGALEAFFVFYGSQWYQYTGDFVPVSDLVASFPASATSFDFDARIEKPFNSPVHAFESITFSEVAQGGDTQCSDGDDNDEDGFDDMDDPGCSNPDDNSEGSPARGLFAGLAEGDVSEMQKISDQSGGALIGFTNPLDYSANNYLDNLSKYDDQYEDIFGQAPTGGQVVVMGLLRDIHYENVSDIASVVSINSVNMDGVGVDGGATVHQMQTTCDGFKIYYYDGFARDYEYIKNNATAVCDSEDTGTWASCNINSISCSNGKASIEFDSFSSYGIEGTGGVVDYMFEDHDSTDGEVHIDSANGDDRDLKISWSKPGATEYQANDTITFSFTDQDGDPWNQGSFASCSGNVFSDDDKVAGAGGAWDFSTPGTAIWTFSEATATDAMNACIQLPQTSDVENVFVSVLGYTYGGGLIYVNDSNDVTVTAEVTPQLEFSIRDENDSNDINACDLGTLAVNSVSSCAYRLKVKTNASSGYEVRIATDGELRKAGTAGSVSDLDKILPVTNGTTVITASEAYGVAIDAGQTSTGVVPQEQGIYSVDDSPLEYVSTAELLYTVGAPNVPSNTGDTTNTALVTHKASILAGTSAGNYAQQVKYYVTANF